MNLSRIRQPLVGAFAVLLIGGASIANAASPGTPVAVPQAGLSAPAVVTAPAAEVVEPVTPDTDTLQEGDQTTLDAPVGAADVTGTAAEVAGTDPGEATGTEATGTEPVEAAGTEAAGSGGHADNPSDPNADHKFDGQE